MTQEQFDELLEKLETYKFNLDNEERGKEEYLGALIDDFKAKEDDLLSDTLTLEDLFYQWRESQEFKDGGYRDVMYSDVDEDDHEYQENYDPYDNEEIRIHSELLDELEEYLEI